MPSCEAGRRRRRRRKAGQEQAKPQPRAQLVELTQREGVGELSVASERHMQMRPSAQRQLDVAQGRVRHQMRVLDQQRDSLADRIWYGQGPEPLRQTGVPEGPAARRNLVHEVRQGIGRVNAQHARAGNGQPRRCYIEQLGSPNQTEDQH